MLVKSYYLRYYITKNVSFLKILRSEYSQLFTQKKKKIKNLKGFIKR